MALQEEKYEEEININSNYFHNKAKGCKLEIVKIKIRTDKKTGNDVTESKVECKTHDNVRVCRCGWQFGWHGGTKKNIKAK